MFSPLTKVLLKIFAAGFYRAHSGMLIFLFGTVISYCFFINTLGSVPIWAFAEWNLVITLAVVTNPFVLLLFFLVSMGYTIKSLQYNAGLLSLKSHEFLYYSSSSCRKPRQFRSWFIVQFNILLPLWVYGFFATVIGFNYGHYLLPFCMLLFPLLLNTIAALFYLRTINRLVDINRQTLLMKLISTWSKPVFFLYTYYVFNKLKITYVITKFSSWVFITGMISLFSDQKEDMIIPAIVILVVITTHSILIYNEYRFTETFLYFSHNFPYSGTKLFFGFCANYLILLLPELLWLVTGYPAWKALGLICLGLSMLLLLRSLLYWSGLNMKRFLFWVFILFNVFFLVILYQAVWYLLMLNIAVAYLIFIRNYSNQHLKN